MSIKETFQLCAFVVMMPYRLWKERKVFKERMKALRKNDPFIYN
jgi:hypothetical protein